MNVLQSSCNSAHCMWVIDKLLLFTVAATCLDHSRLTVDSEAPCGSLGADEVAGSARVLPGITPSGWVNNQGATGDGDPGVGSDSCAAFAPLDCNLCASSPCTPQRHISSLHRYGGNWQTDPGHCIYRKSKKYIYILPTSSKRKIVYKRVSKGTITVGIRCAVYKNGHIKTVTTQYRAVSCFC